ncbi:peroxide stress protein YaaA [Mangrovicoccus sp. HB161399]|uniref:peroxide stress protein YaaA n=1 Tax=Mangrovicoccus sp. HB161399 TaxID=2720392 RepID=UPI0015525CF9|nr:peroxide stress protein YaaA [Mangrovicoccus sp. HB161399]
MLVTVSPAKKLDWTDPGIAEVTEPRFLGDAAYLAGVAADLSADDLRKLMSISEPLARLNRDRFAAYRAETPADARPAVRAFAGDTYQGLEAKTLDEDAQYWARGHLRILSGLYGLLRPYDLIQPYRLEMGSRLKTAKGKNLYEYWGSRIAEALNADAEEAGADVLLNCASIEYFSAVDTGALAVPVVTPVFLEEKNGAAQVISFHAKRARGAMARFVMERRIDRAEALAGFDAGGYRYQPSESTPERPVFLRSAEAAAAA